MLQWVNVKDRVSENGESVLLLSSQFNYYVGFCTDKRFHHDYHGVDILLNITHWMQLPEPPTE